MNLTTPHQKVWRCEFGDIVHVHVEKILSVWNQDGFMRWCRWGRHQWQLEKTRVSMFWKRKKMVGGFRKKERSLGITAQIPYKSIMPNILYYYVWYSIYTDYMKYTRYNTMTKRPLYTHSLQKVQTRRAHHRASSYPKVRTHDCFWA